jgi:hypothetical protein
MKKFNILAAALLFAGAANAQAPATRPAGFRAVNDCIGCDAPSITRKTVNESNPHNYSPTSIDNCSEVVQGGAGINIGNDNRAVVDQEGMNNHAKLFQREGDRNYGKQTQTGEGNRAQAVVWGSDNTTLQSQVGKRNKATINVDEVNGQGPGANVNGNNNWAQQNQDGDDNQAELDQYGDRNLASQDQRGNRNNGRIEQYTNHSTAVQIQVGSENNAHTIQGSMSVSGSDNHQRSSIEQGGDRNQAIVRQDVR